jgi:hypothetical protein
VLTDPLKGERHDHRPNHRNKRVPDSNLGHRRRLSLEELIDAAVKIEPMK